MGLWRVKMNEESRYLEIEVKYSADNVDRMAFKEIAKKLDPKSFVYAESYDIYYIKEDGFLRYRMPMENDLGGPRDAKAELTFKKKHAEKNNIVRTEVNLRIDFNKPELVHAFCEGIGYKKNFSIYKMCDIYIYPNATLVYYSVRDENGKYANFLEIEANEDANFTEQQAKEILQWYEKHLLPLGITAQNRKKLSLFEMYMKPEKLNSF
jgi:adenylate cyclase class IV